VEIATVIDKSINKNEKLNIPKDKDGFFKYLNTSLSNERAGSYNVGSIFYNSNDGNDEINALDFITTHEDDPQYEYLS
jgi:hypothetical protein